MITTLPELLQEIFLDIISRLHTSQLISLAFTFNKDITPLCGPYLEERKRAVLNENEMRRQFGELPECDQNQFAKNAHCARW